MLITTAQWKKRQIEPPYEHDHLHDVAQVGEVISNVLEL